MVNNHFLNTATQKPFINVVPCCSEHYLKLLSILQEAQRRRKSLCVCWLDLANTFSSMHHDLIIFALAHFHAHHRCHFILQQECCIFRSDFHAGPDSAYAQMKHAIMVTHIIIVTIMVSRTQYK